MAGRNEGEAALFGFRGVFVSCRFLRDFGHPRRRPRYRITLFCFYNERYHTLSPELAEQPLKKHTALLKY